MCRQSRIADRQPHINTYKPYINDICHGKNTVGQKVRRFIIVSSVLAAICVLVIVVEFRFIHARAQTITNGQPYCIQIPGDRAEYREATSWKDLTVFRLRGSGARHHAVLVVGSYQDAELFHWSYWKNEFVKGTYGQQPIYCNPRINFLNELNATVELDQTHLDFHMAGMHFSIPNGFHPKPLWSGRFGLLISVSLPAFSPTAKPWPTGVLGDTLVEVAFYQRPRLQTWLQSPNAEMSVIPSTQKYGLDSQVVSSNRYGSKSTQYFVRAADGRVTSLLQCIDGGDCLHSFEHDGWTFDFRHATSDISRWREMESQLVALVRSFIKQRESQQVKTLPRVH
jgi:hypothetical protein